jgi:hypothetical protein
VEAVEALPQVTQAGAIPVPDAALGERICVCVALRPGTSLTLDELRREFQEGGVAKFKTPERLEIFTDLPLTPPERETKKNCATLSAEGMPLIRRFLALAVWARRHRVPRDRPPRRARRRAYGRARPGRTAGGYCGPTGPACILGAGKKAAGSGTPDSRGTG